MTKLTKYKKKRNFSETSEPRGSNKTAKAKSKRLRFVVQRHHASRLHYDLRLEWDGVLKSWAVPKGPSLYPKDKRLAVQVEDHPIDYGTFEGVIPHGNYGAGVVHIFDSGYYDLPEGKTLKEFSQDLKEGSIKFTLHGNLLRGEFALVQMKGQDPNAWLLIKHQDRYATDAAYNSEDHVPRHIKEEGKVFKEKKKPAKKHAEASIPKAMLATRIAELPEESGWRFEKKYDGFRIMAQCSDGRCTLYSRTGKNMNALFPSLVKELSQLDKDVSLDGEIVVEDKSGKPHFQDIAGGEPLPRGLKLYYYVFDILRLEGEDLTDYTLQERDELLGLFLKRIQKKVVVREVEVVDGSIKEVISYSHKQKWEGVLAKRLDSRYLEGKRSAAWGKYKLQNGQEVVVCGYTAPAGSRDYFGALVLGIVEDDTLRYVGNCGTGFDTKALKEGYELMQPLVQGNKPFADDIVVAKEKDVTWIDPVLVAEVYYMEWTDSNRLRHPVFKGWRKDKVADEIEKEETVTDQSKETHITIGRKKVQLTNLDKIYWPNQKYTKGHLIAYYEEMADLILPYLRDKPISLNRFPNGIGKDSFFQKDMDPSSIPDWLKTVPVKSESTEKITDYLICNDAATLLYLANLGSIEINPWLSTYRKPEYPEYAVLDLDPNGTDMKTVVKVAQSAHEILTGLGIDPFLKTSGSTGLHIYIYLNKKYTYDVVRDFVQLLAQMLHEMYPDATSVVRDPKKRKGLLYLDFLQNRRAQTVVAPYSVRPKEEAPVSTPLFWEELSPKLEITDYTIKNTIKRIKKVGDPWEAIKKKSANLKQAIGKL